MYGHLEAIALTQTCLNAMVIPLDTYHNPIAAYRDITLYDWPIVVSVDYRVLPSTCYLYVLQIVTFH